MSTSEDFTQGGSLIETRTGILGTRYSPTTTYDNNQYFWRVRAVDLDNRATAWSPGRSSFNRTWPDVPTLVHPAEPGNEVVGDPMYFEWESVRHASEYELQVGTQPNFTVGTFKSCRVAGTTYVAGQFAINTTGQPSTNRANEDCEPKTGQLNYWRVRPLDRPFTKGGDIPGVQGIFSETQTFLYQPLNISGVSPSGNQTVAVPTLSWAPVTGNEYYEVEIVSATGDRVAAATTYSPSWTLPGTEQLDPADNPHTWRVSATSTKGAKSVIYVSQFNIGGQPPTSAAAPLTPLTPTSSTIGLKHAPQLTWEPMPGAHHYSVNVGTATDTDQIWFGASGDSLFGKPVPYPAMTDTSLRLLLPGTYDWQVTAYDLDNRVIGRGTEGRFTVEDVALTTGHEVALGGSALAPGNTVNACTPGEVCTVPSDAGAQVDARPVRRVLHGLRQRGRQLHQPAGAQQPRPRHQQHHVRAHAGQRRPHLRRQPGGRRVLLVRPAVPQQAELRPRPGLDRRQGPDELRQALAEGHRPHGVVAGRHRDHLRVGLTTSTPTGWGSTATFPATASGRRPARTARRRPSSTGSRSTTSSRSPEPS